MEIILCVPIFLIFMVIAISTLSDCWQTEQTLTGLNFCQNISDKCKKMLHVLTDSSFWQRKTE